MSDAPEVGDPAPPLRHETLDGETFELSEWRGRPVVVSFLRHAG